MKPLLLTLTLGFLLLTPALSLAQTNQPDTFVDPTVDTTDYTISEGFVPCSGVSCSTCDFIVMANTIIKWIFGLAMIFFAILAVVAGIKLVTSGGNPSAKTAAKNSFTNAFIGLFIFLAAWLLVDTLLRNLLGTDGVLSDGNIEVSNFGPWMQVKCGEEQATATTSGSYYPGDPTYEPGEADRAQQEAAPESGKISPVAGCTGGSCVPLTIPCSARGCNIAPGMVQRLENMHNQANVSGARVTEAMPPSRVHKSSCHNNGTCIDYSKSGGMSAAEVKRVINAAYANGLRPVYEVRTQAQKDALVAGGVPAGSIKVLGNWISAPHFSIYGY